MQPVPITTTNAVSARPDLAADADARLFPEDLLVGQFEMTLSRVRRLRTEVEQCRNRVRRRSGQHAQGLITT